MKHSSVILLCSALIGLAVTACIQPQPTPREALIQRLQDLQQRGCMFGHQDDSFYGIGWEYEDGRSDVLESCGDWPAVMGFDLGGIEMGDSKNLDSVPFDCIRQQAVTHHLRGGIVTISWHPRNPLTALEHLGTWPEGSAWEVTDGAVVAILPGGERHELFMTWLERVRAFLLSLRTEDGELIPFIFRPWHENNGAWFWWGNTHCTPEEYRALYALTQDYLTAKRSNSDSRVPANNVQWGAGSGLTGEAGLTSNVVWSYSPNLDGNMPEEKFLQWYPGDERIDVIGLDAYQWGTEEDFVRQTRADLDMLCAFAQQHGKLAALTECGLKNVADPTWWHRVLLPILQDYPLAYALVWRNAEHEFFGPVPNTDNGENFKQFHAAPRTLFLKEIQ